MKSRPRADHGNLAGTSLTFPTSTREAARKITPSSSLMPTPLIRRFPLFKSGSLTQGATRAVSFTPPCRNSFHPSLSKNASLMPFVCSFTTLVISISHSMLPAELTRHTLRVMPVAILCKSLPRAVPRTCIPCGTQSYTSIPPLLAW
jgi:hypothetical protein